MPSVVAGAREKFNAPLSAHVNINVNKLVRFRVPKKALQFIVKFNNELGYGGTRWSVEASHYKWPVASSSAAWPGWGF